MTITAPHLDRLELANSLRDHVFTLVRAGEMNAALLLIRADVHAAATALADAAEAQALAGSKRTRRGTASVTPPETDGDGETDGDAGSEGGTGSEGGGSDGDAEGEGGEPDNSQEEAPQDLVLQNSAG